PYFDISEEFYNKIRLHFQVPLWKNGFRNNRFLRKRAKHRKRDKLAARSAPARNAEEMRNKTIIAL
ncbi:MAG: hypothetical protein ACRCUY_04020, partial [Thermoguttaceae bacterium]